MPASKKFKQGKWGHVNKSKRCATGEFIGKTRKQKDKMFKEIMESVKKEVKKNPDVLL